MAFQAIANLSLLQSVSSINNQEKLYATCGGLLVKSSSWRGRICRVYYELIAFLCHSNKWEEKAFFKSLQKTYVIGLEQFRELQIQIDQHVKENKFASDNIFKKKRRIRILERSVSRAQPFFDKLFNNEIHAVFSHIVNFIKIQHDSSHANIIETRKALDSYRIFSAVGVPQGFPKLSTLLPLSSEFSANDSCTLPPVPKDGAVNVKNKSDVEEICELVTAQNVKVGDVIKCDDKMFIFDQLLVDLYKCYHYLKAGILPTSLDLSFLSKVSREVLRVKEKDLMTILLHTDPQHMAWIKELKAGDTIQYEGRDWVLKEAVRDDRLEGAYKTFLVEDDKTLVFGLYCHENLCALFSELIHLNNLPNWQKELLPEVRGFGTNIVVYERLGGWLRDIRWEEGTYGHSDQENKVLLSVVLLVRLFMQNNEMCQKLLEYGRMSFDGRIKFSQLRIVPFCPVQMEYVLDKLSRNNHMVLADLLDATGLGNFPHPDKSVRRLHEEAFNAALNDQLFDPETKASVLLGARYPGVEANLELFIARVKQLKRDIAFAIGNTYEYSEFFLNEDLIQDVKKYLLKRYRESRTVSLINRSIQDDVLVTIIKKYRPRVSLAAVYRKLKEITDWIQHGGGVDEVAKQLKIELFNDFLIFNEGQIVTEFIPKIHSMLSKF